MEAHRCPCAPPPTRPHQLHRVYYAQISIDYLRNTTSFELLFGTSFPYMFFPFRLFFRSQSLSISNQRINHNHNHFSFSFSFSTSAQNNPVPRLAISFICTVPGCSHRSTHQFTKSAYQKGVGKIPSPVQSSPLP